MPYLNQQDVVSSNIAKVGYDDTLYILFNKGIAYKYYDVPKSLYIALIEAESVGCFFHNNIRCAYDCERLETHNF